MKKMQTTLSDQQIGMKKNFKNIVAMRYIPTINTFCQQLSFISVHEKLI